MSFSAVYDIAGQSMAAQTVRMNTVASNLANARSAASSEANIYRERDVVFRADPVGRGRQSAFGVTVSDVLRNERPAEQRYQPGHPLADNNGIVYYANVNTVEQMVAMMAASRQFEATVSVLGTTRRMQDQLVELVSLR
ncbi:flagellar basal body rod protein FlgC [Kistimonas scapharcae]|uniref:Flagellar basal-body rod protein FlgC n=1 Tax=Kistimonas scapharcae TaxID=1036133 RepID=A0ABP8V962_9GAMM